MGLETRSLAEEALQSAPALAPSMSWIHSLRTKESLGWARNAREPAPHLRCNTALQARAWARAGAHGPPGPEQGSKGLRQHLCLHSIFSKYKLLRCFPESQKQWEPLEKVWKDGWICT